MKYERLSQLEKKGIPIPHFFLYSGDLRRLDSCNTDTIILRSSYVKEDQHQQSLAGVFSSIGSLDISDTNNIKAKIDSIQDDATIKIEKLGGNIRDFQIIIQEYIKTDLGGVIFVEGDKVLIEVHSGAGAEKVVEGNSEQSLYSYKDFSLSTGEKLLSKKQIKGIFKQIKKIQSIYDFNLDIEFGILGQDIYIFQVRPITRSILHNYYVLDSSNIGENFNGKTTKLTSSFVKRLYSKVYKSVAYNSGISYEKIANAEHIFDDLIVYKNKKIYYNIISWYKFLLLFPGDNKTSFDTMIGTKLSSKYLYIDDIYEHRPSIFFKIKYIYVLIIKIFTFNHRIKKLENYLEKFYIDFEKIDLKEYSLNDLYILYKNFEQHLSYLWYVTIDNDFVIMKLGKNIDLGTINGLISTNQLYFLQEVANGKRTKQEYLNTYGHRFGDELKLECSDITENPEIFERLIEQYKNLELHNNGNSSIQSNNFLLKYIKNREQFRLYRSKNFSIARKIFLSIGEKFVEKNICKNIDDVFDYEVHEIFDKILENNTVVSNGTNQTLMGEVFEGRVYIMDEFHIPDEKIEIVVAKSFDPGWIVLLGGVKGVILENGNMLSHVSIICRELNIPLLIGVKDATSIYKNGDILTVNGDGIISHKK